MFVFNLHIHKSWFNRYLLDFLYYIESNHCVHDVQDNYSKECEEDQARCRVCLFLFMDAVMILATMINCFFFQNSICPYDPSCATTSSVSTQQPSVFISVSAIWIYPVQCLVTLGSHWSVLMQQEIRFILYWEQTETGRSVLTGGSGDSWQPNAPTRSHSQESTRTEHIKIQQAIIKLLFQYSVFKGIWF